MQAVATTWAKCHDEPAAAEYQTIVPKAKPSDRSIDRQH